MDDDAVLSQINDLVAEEHRLLESHGAGSGLNVQEEARLKAVPHVLGVRREASGVSEAKGTAEEEAQTSGPAPNVFESVRYCGTAQSQDWTRSAR